MIAKHSSAWSYSTWVYSNAYVGYKVTRKLPLVAIYTYQELGVHTIKMSALSNITCFEMSSRSSIDTTNSTSVDSDNIMYQYSYANINIMI